MASFSDPTYNRAKDSASSGGYVTDLTPERSYDVDVRRLDEDEQLIADRADTRNERKQNRVRKFFQAAKAAGKYRQKNSIDEPLIRGKPTKNEAYISGTFTPSLGDEMGPAGGMKYAEKPQPFSGRSYQWLDAFF